MRFLTGRWLAEGNVRSMLPKLSKRSSADHAGSHSLGCFTASSCRKRSANWRYILIRPAPQGPSRQRLCALFDFFGLGGQDEETGHGGHLQPA